MRVLHARESNPDESLKTRILALERLKLNTEDAITYYINQAEKKRVKFNKKLKTKTLKEGSLVLRYDNRFDNKKDDKFVPHWEGPFEVKERYSNGSYQLMDASGDLHKTRVNRWRLKPYFSQAFNGNNDDKEELEQEA